MTYAVYKDGISILTSHKQNILVKSGLTWKEAYDLIWTKKNVDSNYRYWFTHE